MDGGLQYDRYRNFETLHKILRDDPVYQSLKLKLPRKGFLHSQNTEFVEERRVSLDRYDLAHLYICREHNVCNLCPLETLIFPLQTPL